MEAESARLAIEIIGLHRAEDLSREEYKRDSDSTPSRRRRGLSKARLPLQIELKFRSIVRTLPKEGTSRQEYT